MYYKQALRHLCVIVFHDTQLTLLTALISASDLISIFTTSKWPLQAAECKGVHPFCMVTTMFSYSLITAYKITGKHIHI